MANSSRIREALDKSISLGPVGSGEIQLNNDGVYTIRLTNTWNSSSEAVVCYIEAEVIYGHIAVLRSFCSKASTKYRIRLDGQSLYFSTTNTVAGNTFKPQAYVEYNLKPVTLVTVNNPPALAETYEYDFGRAYFLEKTILAATDEIRATSFSTKTLETQNFTTNAASISVLNNSTISVPNLLVQTVGLDVAYVKDVNADSISTSEIILKNATNSTTNPAWKFTTANGEVYIEAEV